MRLKNRETGEIPERIETIAYIQWSGKIMLVYINSDGEKIVKYYDSLRSFNEEWEDYNKEPEEYWFVAGRGVVEYALATGNENDPFDKGHKELGNYFDTHEKAKQAVEKLQALKRLKDKGFRFTGWEDLQAEMSTKDLMLFNRDIIDANNIIGFRMDDYHDCIKDLNICFGGGE